MANPFQSLSKLVKPEALPQLETVLTWTLPALLIPPLAYKSNDKNNQNVVFARELTRYSLGTSAFLGAHSGTLALVEKLAPAWPANVKRFAAFAAGMTSNITYVGALSEKVTHWFNGKFLEKTPGSTTSLPHQRTADTVGTVASGKALSTASTELTALPDSPVSGARLNLLERSFPPPAYRAFAPRATSLHTTHALPPSKLSIVSARPSPFNHW